MLLLTVLATVVAPVHALSTGTALSYGTIVVVLGTLFFVWAARNDRAGVFLFLGNLSCLAGNVVFCVLLVQMEGNMYYFYLFTVMGLLSVYGLWLVIADARKNGCGYDSDDESDGEEKKDDSEPRRLPGRRKTHLITDREPDTPTITTLRQRNRRS